MSRLVWPYFFTLRAGNLIASSKDQNLPVVRAEYFPTSNGNTAIALRWSCTPNLGFPREPFQVYRRLRGSLENLAYVTVLDTSTAITAQAQTFPTTSDDDLAYIVLVNTTIGSTGSITIQAIDAKGLPIPNQQLTQTADVPVEFRCPGIAAVSISGSGSVDYIQVIGETVYANLADWAQIQTVGLPLLDSEIGTSYRTQPQGFWVDPLTPPVLDGVDAAVDRTFVTAELELGPPPTGIVDFPLAAWVQPDPTAYISDTRAAGGLVPMIERCLENSVDTDAQMMQSAYTEMVTTDGLSQIGVTSPPSQSSQVTLPITSVAMLAVSTDPYAAVALGYGTLDIPPTTGGDTIGITIAPTNVALAPGGTAQFTAAVTGTSATSVLWGVNGVLGGFPLVGTVTAAGLYTAPATVPAVSVYVGATSAQDPTQSATTWVNITASQISIGKISTPTAISKPLPVSVAAKPQIYNPAPILPPVDVYGAFDYMATAPFVFPFGFDFTLAALSVGQPPVEDPASLVSSLSQVYVPFERDQPAPATIRITWDAADLPQGYGILASRAPNQSQVLNAPRAAAVGGYNVFVGLPPLNPDPNVPPDQQGPAFSDVECALPLAAPPVNNRYLVAAQDIFGQWSDWVETDTSLSPAPVTKPGLINAVFLFTANTGSPPSPVVTASLRIDFAWNWQDRAPGQIRFTGQFVPAPATSLNPPYLGGFATNNSGPIGPPVILTFSYLGIDPDTVNPSQVIPTITSGHTSNGPVAILGEGSPPAPSSNPDLVQYRVELSGIQLDFSAAYELDFLLYATATEQVQPGVWSDPTDQPTTATPTSPPTPPLLIGRIVKAIDPNPPTVTFAPPAISWTALPDATGTARGVLEWEPDLTAAGYYVWEATESALLHLLPPGTGTPDPPADTPYVTRAGVLKDLLDAWYDSSLQGFARLTQEPISGSRTEIALPGSAETLYAYRISAIGNNNVQSERSTSVAIFGVPRRNVPGTPRILLRSGTGSPPGLQIIVLPVESSATPAGYRLFRVRSQALSLNATSMGPAKIDELSPLWQDYSSVTLAGNPLNGKSVLDTAAIPSWYPYYYRATAVGAQDLANGVYRGESAYSSVQVGYVLPPSPPLIASFQVAAPLPGSVALITLITDLPSDPASPIGGALVELLRLDRGSPPAAITLQQILSSAPENIPVGIISPPPLLAPLTIAPRIERSAPDANGYWTIYMLIPYSAAEAGTFVLRLTDPLARQSTTSF